MITNKQFSLLAPTTIIGIAVSCLWANEGRFDYYQAANTKQPWPPDMDDLYVDDNE